MSNSTDYAQFITASPSSYHAAAEAARILDEAGYRRQIETEPWDASPGGHYLVRGGALMAWRVPHDLTRPRFTILGVHTDSPGFKVKPNPTSLTAGAGQVGVETYGGLLGTSWLNRDLGLAGEVVTGSGTRLVRTGPIMVIPQLAIHLNRGSGSNVELNMQSHAHPVCSLGQADLLGHLQTLADTDEEILGFDLVAFDTHEPELVGLDGEFFAAGRQDNLLSVHAGLEALTSLEETGDSVAVFAAFDHEEIGSRTATGAAGPILETVLRRTAEALGAQREDDVQRAFADSVCLSADCGHAVHPNYMERHDPDHHPVLGGGLLIKYNANQAYTTTGRGAALVKTWAGEAGAPLQDFVSRNDQPCGSTIGPITATRLGIHTIDVGAPLWSMHSIREISSPADRESLVKVAGAFWSLG